MDDAFKIFVEQLREGNVEKIEEQLSPDFLDIHEEALIFDKPISIKGEAYLAENELVLRLDISTSARLPCSICNEPVELPIQLKGFYHSEPLDAVKSGIFNMKDTLREGILLETPKFAECRQGSCPKRKDLEKYFKKTPVKGQEDDGYRPFSDLKLE